MSDEGTAAGSSAETQDDGLLPRLRLIEDQPLEARAEAYAHVHDELRLALDAADRRRGDEQGAADRRRGDEQGAADRQDGR